MVLGASSSFVSAALPLKGLKQAPLQRVDRREFWLEVYFYTFGVLILLLAVIQCPAHIKGKKKNRTENEFNSFHPMK